MNVRELRIGNIIYSDIRNITVDYNVIRLQTFADCGGVDGFKGYKPIELTEEWFLRFGFKKAIESEYTRDSFQKNKILLWNKNLDFSVLIFMPTSTEIKYVHQLQNLYFALTGEELTIK